MPKGRPCCPARLTHQFPSAKPLAWPRFIRLPCLSCWSQQTSMPPSAPEMHIPPPTSKQWTDPLQVAWKPAAYSLTPSKRALSHAAILALIASLQNGFWRLERLTWTLPCPIRQCGFKPSIITLFGHLGVPSGFSVLSRSITSTLLDILSFKLQHLHLLAVACPSTAA